MAPMALDNHQPTKRSASAIDFDIPAAKRRILATSYRTGFTRDRNGLESSGATFNGHEEAEQLLTRSIGLALEAVGFEASEPLALESFRLAVEECMRLSRYRGVTKSLTDYIRHT